MPKITRDQHQSGSILSSGTELRVVKLPPLSNEPIVYTVTVGAAALGATQLNITSITPAPSNANPFFIGEGVELYFGGSANYPFTGGTEVFPTESKIFTTGTGTIKVEPLTAALSASANAKTLGMLKILGLQGADQSQNTNLISIRDFTSGLANSQRPVMIDFSLSLSGWIHQYDLALTNIVRPLSRNGNQVYYELWTRDGEVQYGRALFSNYARQNQLDDVLKFTCDFVVNGTPRFRYPVLAFDSGEDNQGPIGNPGGGTNPPPTSYDTRIDGTSSGAFEAFVTFTTTSNSSYLEFNALSSAGGLSQRQDITYNGSAVAVIDFPGDYLGRPARIFVGEANQSFNITFTGTDTPL